MRLENKIAVITGAARGIGFSIAKKIAQEGATVIIFDLGADNVNSSVNQLIESGYIAKGFDVDVTDSEKIESVMKEIVKEFGRIDILINNAGITRDALIMKMKESDWDMVMNVNLKGAFICTSKVARIMMKQRDGVIINMASVIGIMGNIGQANYAASKAGMIALTKSAAKELAARNVRVNAIAPGFIETEMTATLPEEVVKEYFRAIPLNRMGKPDDIANLCIFLSTPEAGYITGQTIKIDGGLIM
ncbi:MAG: 3-oxoacyl-[acyl-carrier-protein] reductase [Candidatus Cloacimonetes bacterium]|nr:3-oxoacyl-[acyl-carrier-protein] reductase [Candidatus Cloacimonadota bacterium]